MSAEGRKRIVIEAVSPEIDCGRFAIRRAVGEKVTVQADIFADGHEEVAAALLVRPPGGQEWREVPMEPLGNDRWQASFAVQELGEYTYTLTGWLDAFLTWQKDLAKRLEAGQEVPVELQIGAGLIRAAARKASGAKERSSDVDARALERLARRLEEATAEAGSTGVADPSRTRSQTPSQTRSKTPPQTRSRTPFAEILSAEVAATVRRHADRLLAYRYERELLVRVERSRALFSAWYELFPRSAASLAGKHGTFRDMEALLPDIASLGFDVLYLPPIHPIGQTNRKGKNNAPEAGPEDPGSPWAIGSAAGGHKAVHPQLGTLEEFEDLVAACGRHGLEVALDIAFQCSPDHPYVKEHPEWFRWRPDGTVQFAENPPKKYEDILPINFESESWRELWEELKEVVLFWVARGVRIFRMDNPHTKPFAFWEWLIAEVKRDYPEVIFLAEAFTRPKVMYRLAKLGFTQSYTYFTWRNTKREFTDYLTELTRSPVREYFVPSFWPNTPDILPEHLQFGGRAAFLSRLVLAGTLSSSYGIYGPPFELCVPQALPEREEYLDSEKYEIKSWDRRREGNIREAVAAVNRIRRENPALQTPWNLRFLEIDDPSLLAYLKAAEDDTLVVVVNLDPYQPHSGTLHLPLAELGISERRPFLAHELLSGNRHVWQGATRAVTVDPEAWPAAIFRLHPRLRREQDFDYYM